jgi:DNA-binding Lrp family transcriptional regulator
MVKSTTELSSVDKAILRHLQRDGRATNAELSQAANLSESACLRRVKQLEQSGVIERYAAMIAPTAVGFSLTVYVTITLSNQSQDALAAFEKAAKALPEVIECHLMTGAYDYMLKLVAKDTDDLERLHSSALTRLPGVARVVSSLALRTVIQRTGVPVL